MIELFPHDSLFIKADSRTKRWAVPYHYEALNSRAENLLIRQKSAIKRQNILDLGCHFGTFAYACLAVGADFVQGVDSEERLIKKAGELFFAHQCDPCTYSFRTDDVIGFLESEKENSFDTILCLGLFYYIHDQLRLLKLMKKVAKKYIILDTFTAYYGACVAKEHRQIAEYTKPETFNLPFVLYPLTQARKLDYTLPQKFARSNKRTLSVLSLPTLSALENFFTLLDLKFRLLSWDDYVVNHDTSWQDFIEQENKEKAHWADVYHTKIRVSYLLEV